LAGISCIVATVLVYMLVSRKPQHVAVTSVIATNFSLDAVLGKMAVPTPTERARKKKQHVVPQSYLRAWVDNGDQLRAIMREPKKPDRDFLVINVRDAASQNYFYAVRGADGAPLDDVEDALSVFDDLVPGIVRRATVDAMHSKITVGNLKYMYANFAARNELGRDMLVEHVAAMRAKAECMFEAEFPDRSALDNADLVDGLMRAVWEHPAHYASDPETISRLAIVPKADDLYNAMPKYACVLESEEVEFFTSDAPFGSFDPHNPPEGSGVYGPAFDDPRVELTLPLGRRHAVLFANVPMPLRATISPAGAAVINARTVFFSRRSIYTHNSEEATNLAWFLIEHYRDCYHKPLLDAVEEENARVGAAG